MLLTVEMVGGFVFGCIVGVILCQIVTERIYISHLDKLGRQYRDALEVAESFNEYLERQRKPIDFNILEGAGGSFEDESK